MRYRIAKGAVRQEMRKLARQKIKEGIKTEGLVLSSVSRKEIDRLVMMFLKTPEGQAIAEHAKRNVIKQAENENADRR
jgi:hypothetical protein